MSEACEIAQPVDLTLGKVSKVTYQIILLLCDNTSSRPLSTFLLHCNSINYN